MNLFERISKCKNAQAQAVNPNLMQVSLSKGKTPGFLKVAVGEHIAEKFLNFGKCEYIGIMVFIPRDEWEQSAPKDGEVC